MSKPEYRESAIELLKLLIQHSGAGIYPDKFSAALIADFIEVLAARLEQMASK